MANTLESHIQQIAARAASQIAQAVRANIADEVNKLLATKGSTEKGAAPPKRRGRPPKAAAAAPVALPVKRGPGRPKKSVVAEIAPPVVKAARAKASKKGGRRSSEQVTADNDKLLAFIKANPGRRSEDIQKGAGMAKPNVASGLQALREAGKVKMKGIKRAATYTAG